MFFFANLSEICYNVKDATNKELMGSRGVSLASIALLSALLNLVIICLTRLCSGQSLWNAFSNVKQEDRKALFIQGCMQSLTVIFVNSGFLALPMTILMIILGTIPFVSGILARIFLGSTLDCYTICTMIVCFGGVILLACANGSPSSNQTDWSEVSDRSA